MRTNATQKAYDEAFLACSTAIYFEGENNEKEALRSWKIALDHIYCHNARRNPATYRPASETEKTLIESLRQLELQCKERVDLLQVLRRSREEAKINASSSMDRTNVPSPTLHRLPVLADGANNETGEILVPPISYADLAGPPALPYRPAMALRNASGTGSVREYILAQTQSNTSLHAGPAVAEGKSRSPSPEKKGRMLRTLRPGKEKKTAVSKSSNAQKSRPDASKAASQAWSFKTTSSTNKASLNIPYPFGISPGTSGQNLLDKSERPGMQPSSHSSPSVQANTYFRAGEGSATADFSGASQAGKYDSESTKRRMLERTAPSTHRKATDSSKVSNALGNGIALPSYRKEYSHSSSDSRTIAASAAARSYSDSGTDKNMVTHLRKGGLHSSNQDTQAPKRESPESQPILLEDEEEKSDEGTRLKSRSARKARAREDSMRAELPSDTASEAAESDQEAEDRSEWERRMEEIMKSLPRGVDKQAAKQILNEIVIQGDEVHWNDVAGLDIAKSALKETVVYPFLRPDLFMGLREPARGMLLFGPPGTGKTMLAKAVATESKSTFFAISASSLTSKFLGESEKLVRALFQLAKLLAPSIIFVDEIDSLLSSRSGGEHEATRRIKTEFLIQWSDLQKAAAGRDLNDKERERGDASRVLVLAATNLPWAIDEAARRRFVRRQYIPLPEDWVRKQQIRTLLSHQKHELGESDLDRLVRLTEGFSGSDITALAKDAAMGPLRSLGEKLLSMTMDQIRPIEYQDFIASLRTIRPSVSKQGLREFEDWAREFGERGG